MGNALIPARPLEPVCYHLRHEYDARGERIVAVEGCSCADDGGNKSDQNPEGAPSEGCRCHCQTQTRMRDFFETPAHILVQAPYWRKLKEDRTKSIFARKKLSDKNFSTWKKRYPGWNETDFADLKDQFHSFDVNQDGMIDFDEMSTVLDRIGDTSSEESRRKGFSEVDEDASGTIDFEEFLRLVHKVINGEVDESYGFGKAYTRTARSTHSGSQIPIEIQLQFQLI